MGEIETVIDYSRQIESMLESQLGAKGRGLHEKITSVQTKLHPNIVRKLRYVATIRNKVVHEAGFRIDDFNKFVSTCNDTLVFLSNLKSAHAAPWEGKLRKIFVLVFRGAALWLLWNLLTS